MQETKQKSVTLRIEASEEDSFMDLLKYVYGNKIPTNLDALLDLLFISDKFEVESCLKDCTQALQNLPMTSESAMIYLDLPPSNVMSPTIQPLIEAATNFLVAKFKDLSTFKEEVLKLPLHSLKAFLSSDDLLVNSEIEVFDFVLEWIDKHYYRDPMERREILETHLLPLVIMTTEELIEEVHANSNIDPEFASKMVIRALSFKAETNSHRKRCLAKEEDNAASRQFVERAYIYRPIKVVELELPHPRCVVYLDLTRNELKRILPGGDIYVEIFHLDGREVDLYVKRISDELNFYIHIDTPESSPCRVKYEFAVRRKPQESFESLSTGSYTFFNTLFYELLHEVEWTQFIGDDSSYFINDILHLRIELTVEK